MVTRAASPQLRLTHFGGPKGHSISWGCAHLQMELTASVLGTVLPPPIENREKAANEDESPGTL